MICISTFITLLQIDLVKNLPKRFPKLILEPSMVMIFWLGIFLGVHFIRGQMWW